MPKPDEIDKVLRSLTTLHLTDEELAAQHDGVVRDRVIQARASVHLQRCLICQRRLQFLQEVAAEAEAMQPEELLPIYYQLAEHHRAPAPPTPTPVLQRLGQRAWETWQKVAEALTPPPAAQGAFAYKTSSSYPVTRRTKEGELYLAITEEPDGGLTFSLYSDRPAWAGRLLAFDCVTTGTHDTLATWFSVLSDGPEGHYKSTARLLPDRASHIHSLYDVGFHLVEMEELNDDNVANLRKSVEMVTDEVSRQAWQRFRNRLKQRVLPGSALYTWCIGEAR